VLDDDDDELPLPLIAIGGGSRLVSTVFGVVEGRMMKRLALVRVME